MSDQDKLEHKDYDIYKSYVRTVVKGFFCILLNYTYCCHGWEDMSDIWEAAAMTGNFHGSPGAVERFIFSQGMTSHQFSKWRMFILWKGEFLSLGIKTTRVTGGYNSQYTMAESIQLTAKDIY